MIEKISPVFDDKLVKLKIEGHTPPSHCSDGFCEPTLKHPYTIVSIPEEIRLIFQFSDFFGRMSKLNNRCWLETDVFFKTTGKITEKNNNGRLSTVFFCTDSPPGTTTPTLSGNFRIKK